MKQEGYVDQDNNVIVNDGKYESTTEQVIINNARTSNNGGMIINKATFNVNNTGLLNKGDLTINGINIERANVGIQNGYTPNNCYSAISGSMVVNGTRNKTTGEYSTLINATSSGIYQVQGSVTMNGGKIDATTSAVTEGCYGSITINTKKI